MTPKQVLEAAANRIERLGWCQRRNGVKYGDGPNCAVGAMIAVSTISDARPAQIRVENFLGVPRLMEWNDAPGRTAEEVIAALRAAADPPAKETP